MYYRKQIDKINGTRDWRAAAFWLERHEEEFAPKNKDVSVINQVTVGAAIKPKIIESLHIHPPLSLPRKQLERTLTFSPT